MGRQRDEVLAQLRALILQGEFKPGEPFSESKLADRFAVSRTPVREAIAVLVQEGLVEQIPQVGAMVRTFTHDDTRELIDLRVALEALVVEKLAQSEGNGRLTGLLELHEAMKAAAEHGDRPAFLEVSARFHQQIAENAHYYQAAAMLRMLGDKIKLFGLTAVQSAPNMQDAITEHDLIIRSIADADAEAARNAMIEHLERTYERFGAEEHK